MQLKLIKTEKGYIAIEDKPIPYIADGGTNGQFLCLSEYDLILEVERVLTEKKINFESVTEAIIVQ